MIPCDPGDVVSARRQRGLREEVALVDDRGHPGSVEGDAHDRPGWDIRTVVGLADRQELTVLPRESAEPHAVVCGSQHARFRPRLERPHALVRLLHEQEGAVGRRRPRAPAVLVHARAGVPRCRKHVDDRAVVAAPSNRRATALFRDSFAPPHVVADETRAVDARCRRGHLGGAEGGRPGPVRTRLAHGSTVFRERRSHSGSACEQVPTPVCICAYAPRHSAKHGALCGCAMG